MKKFEMVKDYLMELDISISHEDEAEEMVVIQNPEDGIQNMVIDCEYPIVVLEQMIINVPAKPGELFKRLLQMNRTLVHGAFVLDEEGKRVIFRDTLQLENLDQNELEASIQSLGMALAEYGSELLKYAKNS